ncbi:MAG: hypothetical protein N3A61_05525 [Ignavibacteria bacterium]|nr:hypothetical protein [Ignavibacteria bacterium]
MKKILLFLFGIYLTSSFAGGFENLGVHSRVIGMGGAFFGLGDASYTVFYNPAGLSHLNSIEVNSTYSKLFPGVEDDNLHYLTFSGAVPLGIIGNFGLGVTYLKT